MSSTEVLSTGESVHPDGNELLQLSVQETEQQQHSSSEDEGVFLTSLPAQDNSVAKEVEAFLDKSEDPSQPQLTIDDSDDDDVNLSLSMGRRKTALLLSDEEGNEEPRVPTMPKKMSVTSDEDDDKEDMDGRMKKNKKRIVQRIDSDDGNSDGSEDDDDDVVFRTFYSAEDTSDKPKHIIKYSSDLCDAELSDEEKTGRSESGMRTPTELMTSYEGQDVTPSSTKQKNKKERHPKVPSAKEREETVQKIHSETQRMVRESEISLPYHRPKQRTLAEFLNRRKKTVVPQLSKGSSLKMSMKNLEYLRLLEEKKKDVEEFYKSDSEEDDPDDEEWKPENETKSKETSPAVVVEHNGEVQKNKAEEELSKAVAKDLDELPDITNVADAVPEGMDVSVLEGTLANSESKNEAITESNMETCSESRSENITGLPTDISNSTFEDHRRGEVDRDACQEMENENNDSGVHTRESSTKLLQVKATESHLTTKDGSRDEPLENMEVCEEPAKVNDPFVRTEEMDESLVLTENQNSTNINNHMKEAKNLGTPKFSLLASRLPGLDITKLLHTTPKLSQGGKEDFIDLEEEEECRTPHNASGVIELMDRFVRHSSTKRKPSEKQQVNLNIVSKEKDDKGAEKLVASKLLVTVDAEEEVVAGESVPGARLVSLKTALKAKIREQREEQRLKRVREKQFLESEQVIQDFQDDGGLPNEEAELTDQSDTEYETESEPEENDIILTDKKRKKNKYLNDEAEEEEDGGDDNGDEGGDATDDDEDAVNDDDGDLCQEDEDDDDGASNDTLELPATRRRVLMDDDNSNSESGEGREPLKLQLEETQDITTAGSKLSRTSTSTDDLFASQHTRKGGSVDAVDRDASIISVDSSFELFGSVIPGHQPGGGTRHNRTARPSDSEGESTFLTPFTKIKSTSFGNSKDLNLPIEDSQDMFSAATAPLPSSPSADLSLHLTLLEDSQFPQDTKKDSSLIKQRLDFRGIDCSQDQDELVDLCSGQFTGKGPSTQVQGLCEDSLAPTQDIGELMGLCSGQFNYGSGGGEKSNSAPPATPNVSSLVTTQSNTEEDLIDLCTDRFPSQAMEEDSLNTRIARGEADGEVEENTEDKAEEMASSKLIIFSSDEEDPVAIQTRIKRRKKRKRFMELSDDEDAQHGIEFDDEENEIPRSVFTGFKDKIKGGIRADFLEKEAELSGSDYNSADEEEFGDDDMEEEEGDQEHFDENDLRNQVGRAHLKTVLDSDKREIRLLQEMYLEDGELHGEGRQRQFRWKNLNGGMEDNERRWQSDNEEENEEEQEDAEWRKQRFEREKYLKEQKAKTEYEGDGELFKLKLPTIVRSSSVTSENSTTATTTRKPLKAANTETAPPMQAKVPTNPFSVLSKRGSFLSRDKATLDRIAEITKDKGDVVGGAKQAGNFVFQQLSAEEAQAKSNKPKRTQSVPCAKKARLDRSFFSMDTSKQSSSIFKYL